MAVRLCNVDVDAASFQARLERSGAESAPCAPRALWTQRDTRPQTISRDSDAD